jgi:cbb3-type cytochrome oxidase cytochrome c subunit
MMYTNVYDFRGMKTKMSDLAASAEFIERARKEAYEEAAFDADMVELERTKARQKKQRSITGAILTTVAVVAWASLCVIWGRASR